jgi:hypothetical protein
MRCRAIPETGSFQERQRALSTWCRVCRKQSYVPHTDENLKLFENVGQRKSKPLKEAERIVFQQRPESVLGRFGSDWELLFATSLKEKYTAVALRRGCPDFFIECNGKIFFVEIKHGGDTLSRYQVKFGEMLKKIGVPVFISDGTLTPEIVAFIESP